MRKNVFTIWSGIVICLMACNTSGPKPDSTIDSQAKKNLATFHIVSNAFQTGDVSKLDSVVSPDYIDHTERGDMKGLDSLKASVKWIHENMKDMKMEVKREWADNEYVSTLMRYTGNNPTEMPGFPAGPYDWSVIELSKYNDGKLIEHWAFMEMRTIMKMMQTPITDSSVKK